MSNEPARRDEIVSAYLDDEATAAEVAEIAGDDALTSRAEEFAAVRDTVAEPVQPLAAPSVDALIEAALDHAEAAVGSASRASLGARRLTRSPRLLLAVAAAAIVLAGIVGVGLLDGAGNDSEVATDVPTMDESAESLSAADAFASGDSMADEDRAAATAAQAAPTDDDAPPALAPEMAAEADTADDSATDMAGAAMADEAAQEESSRDGGELMASEPFADTAITEMADTAEFVVEESDQSDAALADTTDAADGAGPAEAADLGTIDSIDELLAQLGDLKDVETRNESLVRGGACAAMIRDHVDTLELDPPLDSDGWQPFIATVDAAESVTIDGSFGRTDDGAAVIVVATPPDCDIVLERMNVP